VKHPHEESPAVKMKKKAFPAVQFKIQDSTDKELKKKPRKKREAHIC
jgi:hypothetical protein